MANVPHPMESSQSIYNKLVIILEATISLHTLLIYNNIYNSRMPFPALPLSFWCLYY